MNAYIIVISYWVPFNLESSSTGLENNHFITSCRDCKFEVWVGRMKLFNCAIVIQFLKLKFFHSNLNFLDSCYSVGPWLFAMCLFLYTSMSVCLPAFLSIYPSIHSIQKINHYFKSTEDDKRITSINSFSFLFILKWFLLWQFCLPTSFSGFQSPLSAP